MPLTPSSARLLRDDGHINIEHIGLLFKPLHVLAYVGEHLPLEVLWRIVARAEAQHVAARYHRVPPALRMHDVQARVGEQPSRAQHREAVKVARDQVEPLVEGRAPEEQASRLEHGEQHPGGFDGPPDMLKDLVAYHDVEAAFRAGDGRWRLHGRYHVR